MNADIVADIRHLLAERQPRQPGPGPVPPRLVVRGQPGRRRRDPRPLRRSDTTRLRTRADGLGEHAGRCACPDPAARPVHPQRPSRHDRSVCGRPLRLRNRQPRHRPGTRSGAPSGREDLALSPRSITPKPSPNRDRGLGLLRELLRHADSAWHAYVERSIKGWTRHRNIVARFGRFPHRNAVLGRDSTAEELAYMAAGGRSFGQRPSKGSAAG